VSDLGDALAFQLRVMEAPEPVREYQFHPTRKWRFDLCYPSAMLAIEADGGQWTGGRHQRGAGYEKDCAKINTATLMGWRVLRFTTNMVDDGRAVAVILRALSGEREEA
jgi:very-short-patch-repair endonuclease